MKSRRGRESVVEVLFVGGRAKSKDILLAIQSLDQLREQDGIAFLHQMLDLRGWDVELRHRFLGVLPCLFFLLPLAKIQFSDEVRQTLGLYVAQVVVVAFDDLLLIRTVVARFAHVDLGCDGSKRSIGNRTPRVEA